MSTPSSKTIGLRAALRVTVNHDLGNVNNDETIEVLVDELIDALEVAAEEVEATPSEVVSAVFTVLDKILRGSRRLSAPGDHVANAAELNRVFHDFLADFGHLPS